MRDSPKLLLVGMIAAAFPAMAATGFFGGGWNGGSWQDDPGFVGPIAPTPMDCWDMATAPAAASLQVPGRVWAAAGYPAVVVAAAAIARILSRALFRILVMACR